MKKLIPFALLFVISMVMVHAVPVDGECDGIPALINGMVYEGNDINSPTVPDVQVDVTCFNNIDNPVLSDNTDENGYYAVVYAPGVCPLNSDVQACVGENCAPGKIETCFQNQINIENIDIFNVPEFGLIAGGVAIAGAVAGFMFLRKRN